MSNYATLLATDRLFRSGRRRRTLTTLLVALISSTSALGTHTPWGGQDQAPVVAPPETEKRALSEQIMQTGQRPAIRKVPAGEYLFRQAEPGTSVAVILDGNFEVRVNGNVVGHAGPGTVAGERASLEAGQRTAGLRALTEGRIAEAAPGTLSLDQLTELAQGHHREDT